MQHGGARAGAGRPSGGVSQTRRLLVAGLQRGLVLAGTDKGFQGTPEEIGIQTVAGIVSDMIQAGEGRNVLQLLALSEHGGAGSSQGEDSALMAALKRMPGMSNGPDSSPVSTTAEQPPATARLNAPGTTDAQSAVRAGQPYFRPQQRLVLEGELVDAADAGAARSPAATPHPPFGQAGACDHIDQPKFEKSKSSGGAA